MDRANLGHYPVRQIEYASVTYALLVLPVGTMHGISEHQEGPRDGLRHQHFASVQARLDNGLNNVEELDAFLVQVDTLAIERLAPQNALQATVAPQVRGIPGQRVISDVVRGMAAVAREKVY
jgi:hypothetical protein